MSYGAPTVPEPTRDQSGPPPRPAAPWAALGGPVKQNGRGGVPDAPAALPGARVGLLAAHNPPQPSPVRFCDLRISRRMGSTPWAVPPDSGFIKGGQSCG